MSKFQQVVGKCLTNIEGAQKVMHKCAKVILNSGVSEKKSSVILYSIPPRFVEMT